MEMHPDFISFKQSPTNAPWTRIQIETTWPKITVKKATEDRFFFFFVKQNKQKKHFKEF